mmetsp:Transcript_21482/g.46210  ORF Transcript_21482/g.46210 Transcript_21482/m.46210 type:complete len:336 (-) Transcript_21482:399-1406(-)
MADGLDALLAEVANDKAAKEVERRRRDEAAQAYAARAAVRERLQASSALAAASVLDTSAAGARAKWFSGVLKRYLEQLLDESVLESIRAELSTRSFDAFDKYYRARPELSTYTLDTELSRMRYAVRTAGGSTLTDPSDIRAVYWPCDGDADATELLWRAANQSLLADLLAALQSVWMDISLSIAVCAKECDFELHLASDLPQLTCRCRLAIQTLGVGDEPMQLAECEATVLIEPSRRRIEQEVHKPRLCDCVVFEESILGVAATLARCEEAQGEGAAAPLRGSDASARSVSSGGLEDVTRELERFMSEETDEPPPPGAPHSSATGSLLSGIFSSW